VNPAADALVDQAAAFARELCATREVDLTDPQIRQAIVTFAEHLNFAQSPRVVIAGWLQHLEAV